MEMTLYQADLSPYAARVRIQLSTKGIEEKVRLVLPPGGMSSDEYKQINPTGKIPALQIGDAILSESATICEFLEYRNRSGVAGSDFAIGERLTLADCALVGALFFIENFAMSALKLERPIPTKLSEYNDRIKQHPIRARTLDDESAARHVDHDGVGPG